MDSKKKKKLYSVLGIVFVVLSVIIYYVNSNVLSIREVIPSAGFYDLDSLTEKEALNEAQTSYILIVDVSRTNSISESNFNLKDSQGKEIPIKNFTRAKGFNAGDNSYEIWFNGETNNLYEIRFKGVTRYYNPLKGSTSFTTPSTNLNIMSITKHAKRSLDNYLQKDIKTKLVESLDNRDEDIWSNIEPYYSPTKKEKAAIAEAYWETFIKDWTKSKLEMIESDGSDYVFKVSYQWAEPDIDHLNKMINEREKQLKKEVGTDYKNMFQIIIRDIPDMIRKTSRKEAKEENRVIIVERVSIEKTADNDVYSFNDNHLLSLLAEPIGRMYP